MVDFSEILKEGRSYGKCPFDDSIECTSYTSRCDITELDTLFGTEFRPYCSNDHAINRPEGDLEARSASLEEALSLAEDSSLEFGDGLLTRADAIEIGGEHAAMCDFPYTSAVRGLNSWFIGRGETPLTPDEKITVGSGYQRIANTVPRETLKLFLGSL